MPKLTINSVCTKGSLYPMICNFQNGYPSEDFECKCAIIQDNNGKKTIAAEFGRILYVGVEDNENMGQTLLLVKNRKTGKVRLIETGIVDLKPIIDLNHDQEETQHQQTGHGIVKPVQYQEISPRTSIIECDVISNTSTPLNSSIGGHRRLSSPSKKGSTTSFSRTHSGHFQHLHNFVVNEIGTIQNHHSETECNKSPKSIKVIETNKMEELTVDVDAKKQNEANKMTTSKELLRNMLEEEETGMESEGIGAENFNFAIDVGTEELEETNKIISNEEPLHNTLEDFLEEKGTDLEAEEISSTIDIEELSIFSSDSVDTSSEFEDENNLKNKIEQEEHEKHWEMKHKNNTVKQYFVAALGLDSKGEKKMKQNADLVISDDNLTNNRTEYDSVSSNHTENIYICNYCEAVFENKGLLIFHLISHEFVMDSNNDVQSNIIRTDRNSDLNEQFNKFKYSESAKRNNESTTTKNGLVDNEQIVTEITLSDNTYICDYCEAVFENKGSLISHLISHEFVNDKSNDVTHAQTKKMLGNDNEHERYTDFNEKCIELNDGKNKTRKHNTFTENISLDNTYICDYCEAVFENKGSLISHLISHEFVNDKSNDVTHAQTKKMLGNDNEHERYTDFNEKCNELNDGKNKTRKYNTFTENISLDNTYICDYCEAMFVNKGSLISHLISHALVKHTDNGTRSRIKRTIASNENERNRDCNKKSNEYKDGDSKKTKQNTGYLVTKNILAKKDTVTENIITSDNTYICDYCKAMFENKRSLISHITSHKKHMYNDAPEQKSKIFMITYNFKNENACSIIKDADNETVTLSKTKTTTTIDGDNNENENTLSKIYGNKIDESRNPELNESNKLKDNENKTCYNQINNGLTATENIYYCDNCEVGYEDKGSLIFHLISHKLIKDIDITLTKIKKSKGTDNKINETVNPSKNYGNVKKQKDVRKEGDNQVGEETAAENTYVCDYCGVVFEDKRPLILHVTSHKFAKDTNNSIQPRITTIKNESNSACSNNYGNSKKQKKRKRDSNEKSKEFKDGVNKKRKYNLRKMTELVNTDGVNKKRKYNLRKKTELVNTDGVNKKTKKYTGYLVTKNILAKKDTVTENIITSDNTYICDYCKAMFENKRSLISHITSHEKHMYNDAPEQKSKIYMIINNFKNENACSIIKDAVNDIVTLSKTKTTIAIDGGNNENENAYSKNYGNKINESRNPELNGLTATENIHFCDYCEVGFEDKGSLIFHLISHKFIKDIDITLTKIKKSKGTDNKINETVNPSKDYGNVKKQKDVRKEGDNQVGEETAAENTYVCDYCGVVFEDKRPLILHVTSHKFAKGTDNSIQPKITTIKNESNSACSNNYGNSKKQKKRNRDINEKSKEFKDGVNKKRKSNLRKKAELVNTDGANKKRKYNLRKKTELVNTDGVNKKRKYNLRKKTELVNTDGVNKKRKYNLRKNTELVKTDQGNQIIKTEIENDTVEVTNNVATKLINCKQCTYKTDDTSNIFKHILSHKQANSNQCEAIYICNDCNREFKSKASLIIHIDGHKNNSRILCITCNSSFTTQAHLINHQNKMHPSTKPYKCTLCDNKYITKQGLAVHIQTHKIKPFRCAICKYQCHKNNFVQHMKSHTDTKLFQCKLCDFKFAKKSGLKQHMVTHSVKKEHKCKICDSKFSLLNGLKRHLLIHLKYKPFKCVTCSAGFKDKSALKRHQKIHTEEKSYKCSHCEYSCITGSDLKRHMKTHDTKLKQKGPEPFQCTMCDSKFSLKSSLVCHMKTHIGEKIHKCTFCDKTFIYFTGLKRHLNVHSKNKPVLCTKCNTSYDNEKALKWHLRRSKKHQKEYH